MRQQVQADHRAPMRTLAEGRAPARSQFQGRAGAQALRGNRMNIHISFTHNQHPPRQWRWIAARTFPASPPGAHPLSSRIPVARATANIQCPSRTVRYRLPSAFLITLVAKSA
jgi:hypothetical protein